MQILALFYCHNFINLTTLCVTQDREGIIQYETTVSVQSSELGALSHSRARECVSPHTRLRGRGLEDPIQTSGQILCMVR
jgi:hypothetical protein